MEAPSPEPSSDDATAYEAPAVVERTTPDDLLVWVAPSSPVVCL